MAGVSIGKLFPRTYSFLLVRYAATPDEQYTRARLLVNFIAVTAFLGLFFFITFLFADSNVPVIAYLIGPTFLMLGTLLLRTALPLAFVSNLLLLFYWISFSVAIYFSGGVNSLVLPWLTLLPFVANVINQYRNAVVWFVMVVLTIAGFAFMDEFMLSLQYTKDPWRALFSYTGLAFVLFFFTTYYHRTQSRLITLLRERNLLLTERQEEVVTQNEELKEQRSLIEAQQSQIYSINEQLFEKLKEIERINDVLEEQREVLMHLTKCRWIKEGELQGALKEVALLASKAMGITQVTVWRMNDTQDRLEAVMSYNSQTAQYSSGISFEVAGYQHYYEVLYAEKIVAVEDVFSHDLTRQNLNDYFIPQNIKSCMDVPYYIGGTLAGTVSFENHGAKRKWTNEDKNFAKALADIVTLAIESAWRREYELKIKEQNETISMINKGLEDRVRKRIEELEKQNEKLAEYAFINSHILRGPLSRMLGLIELLERSDGKDEELINYLKRSGMELDDVVKKINSAIAGRTDLMRKDFR